VLPATALARWQKAQTAKETMEVVTLDEAKNAEKAKSKLTKTWIFKADSVRDFAWGSSRKFVWDAMAVNVAGKKVMCMSFYAKEAYKAQLDITLSKDKSAFDKYIPDYVARHFTLTVDGRTLPLTYVGFEKDKESAYAYFEVSNIAAVTKQISITNSFLHDFTDKQINIMHVTVGGKRQSTKLDYPDTKAGFNF
jgi:hypothetical protein